MIRRKYPCQTSTGGRATFKMPSFLTRVADMNVAATPMKAHNPLNPPITDGLVPVKHHKDTIGRQRIHVHVRRVKKFFFFLSPKKISCPI